MAFVVVDAVVVVVLVDDVARPVVLVDVLSSVAGVAVSFRGGCDAIKRASLV